MTFLWEIKMKGFTLIELLVVVLIIGILSAVALPQYEKAVEKSRATEAMALVSSIAKAEEVYYMANGSYSGDIDNLDIDFSGQRVHYYANAVRTKYFDCRPQNDTESGVWTDAISSCNRLPRGTLYAIAYLKTGGLVCRWYGPKGQTYCKMFGPVSGSEVKIR